MNISLSIVIPVFNGELFIKEAIHSCLAQSYVSEIIVVDDGSTDRSFQVAQSIKDSRLKCYSIQNSGAANARNVGVEKATCDYIAFLDADDYFLPGKTKYQLEAMMTANSHISISSILVSDMDNKNIYKYQKKVFIKLPRAWKKLAIFGQFLIMNTPTLMVSREFFIKVGGFDSNLKTREDHKFLIKSLDFSDLIIDKSYHVVRRVNPASLSNSFDVERVIDNELAFIDSFRSLEVCYKALSIMSLFKILIVKKPSAIFNRKLRRYYQYTPLLFAYFLVFVFLRFAVKKK